MSAARRREAAESLRLFGVVVNAQAEMGADARRGWLDATSEAAGMPPPTLLEVGMAGDDLPPGERERRDEVNREAHEKLLKKKRKRRRRKRR